MLRKGRMSCPAATSVPSLVTVVLFFSEVRRTLFLSIRYLYFIQKSSSVLLIIAMLWVF